MLGRQGRIGGRKTLVLRELKALLLPGGSDVNDGTTQSSYLGLGFFMPQFQDTEYRERTDSSPVKLSAAW